MAFVPVGQPIPVIAQLGDGSTDKYVQVELFDQDENSLALLNLTHVARGLYRNSSFLMPANTFVVGQAIAYTDSGYTVPYEGYIEQQTYSSLDDEGNGGGINTDDPIPAVAQFGDGSTGKFPLAYLYDTDGNEITGSPLAMASVQKGLYLNSSLGMPDIASVIVQAVSYDDADHTTISDDQYISSTVFTNLRVSGSTLPHCPELTISVASFKAYFVRDFPYGNTVDYVMNSDIEKAIIQSTCFVNRNVYCTHGAYANAVLLLAAHYLVMNLRSSSQGVASKYTWLESSKSVGSVSQGFTIPDSILKSPTYSMLTATGYGAQFLFDVYPRLRGQMFVTPGRTNP